MSIIMHVRSFFLPTDISGLAAWYDASDASTITDAGAGAVSQWTDKSGNARTLTQGTAGSRPTTGTRTQNGRNVLDFDGSADYMSASSAFTQGTSDTVFVVCLNDDGADSTSQVVYNSDDVSNAHCRLLKVSTNVWRATSGAALDAGTPNTSAHLLAGVFNGTSGSSLRLDGTSIATGSTGTNSASVSSHVGRNGAGTAYWDGWVAEILHYDSVLSATDIARVEAFLNAKWAIY